MKKLYLLEQGDNMGYDTYDSCVVCAESEDEARYIHPGGKKWNDTREEYGYYGGRESNHWWRDDNWARNPNLVEVTYLGLATEKSEVGVICNSFNAG